MWREGLGILARLIAALLCMVCSGISMWAASGDNYAKATFFLVGSICWLKAAQK